MSPPTFGDLIRQRRKELKLSLREACKEIGGMIHYPHLSRVERNLATPSEALARRIAKAYRMDEEEVVFRARKLHKTLDDLKRKFPNMTRRYLSESKAEE